jgi:hypothetical protein
MLYIYEPEECTLKRMLATTVAILTLLSLTGCIQVALPGGTGTPEATATAPAESAAPAQSTAPASSSTADTPIHAGDGGILFDIYAMRAAADLNGDGNQDEIEYDVLPDMAMLVIDGNKLEVDIPGLAPCFAITDVDKGDKYQEIVLTQKYDPSLADSEKAFSYLYWWDGTSLKQMGKLMDVKFDGVWVSSLTASSVFNGAGQVTCLAHTAELTDLWYMARFTPNGADRMLKETGYAAPVLNECGPLTVNPGMYCHLMKSVTTEYFAPEYYQLYDQASFPVDIRLPGTDTADIYTCIAQAGENLAITAVCGKYWIQLRTEDGIEGWIKVVDHKMQGIWQVMHYTADDVFSGIVTAG